MKELGAPIDYTNLGYGSMREAMLNLARESVPEWTDFSESDLGVLLVELFAYACDITLYYQTRLASNLFPATSDEPDALVQLLRLIGYELRPPAPATANLVLAFNDKVATPIIVPARTKFHVTLQSNEQLTFETERAYKIEDKHLDQPDSRSLRHLRNMLIPVVEGSTKTDQPVGISDGSPNQLHTLAGKPVVAGSIEVQIEESQGVPVTWQAVETLANSGITDRHFVVQRDSTGAATLLFGDGINGMIPPPSTLTAPVKINAVYRIGGGPGGNVPAGTTFVPEPPKSPGLAPIAEAFNPQAAAGGADSEDIDRARTFAPRLFRTQERAVTIQDYVDLALQVPGVAKARAVSLNWNQVAIYVAPSGQVAEPSELLKRDLLAFFENRRMVTTQLKIVGPEAADIYLGATIRAKPYFLKSDVRAAVEAAVARYLEFDVVEFGQPVYLSRIYDVIQSLDYVTALTIFKFSRKPDLAPATVETQDVARNGIIELGPNELPRLGYRDNPKTPAMLPDGTPYRTPIYTIIEGGVEG